MSAHVITLVHGTFTTDASWPKLRSAITDKLDAEVIFREFRWSGRNSHHARFIAAGDLREWLGEGLKQYPESKHFVIAHSHGGNVVLNAVQDAQLRRRISGVACLGTPFLHALPPPPVGLTPIANVVMIIGSIICSLASLGALLAQHQPIGRGPVTLGVLSGLTVFSSLMMLFWPPASLRRKAQRLASELEISLPENFNLLLVQSPGDEASLALAMSGFVSWLTVRLLRIIAATERLMRFAFNWKVMLVGGMAVVVLGGARDIWQTLTDKSTNLTAWENPETKNPETKNPETKNPETNVEPYLSKPIRPLERHPMPPRPTTVTDIIWYPASVAWHWWHWSHLVKVPQLYVVFYVVYMMALATAYAGLCAIVTVGALMALSMITIFFGRDFFGAIYAFEPAIAATPPGRWAVNIVLPDRRAMSAQGIAPIHSSLYVYEMAIEIVAGWVRAEGTG